MKLLIDTNVLIGLEDDGPVAEQFSSLLRNCQKHGIDIFVHEASREDVMRDKDQGRRNATLSRLRKFRSLKGAPAPSKEELEYKYGRCAKANDVVDAKLLHAAAANAIDYVVSDDIGLHKRAKAADLDARVFTVDDTLSWIERTYEPKAVFLPSVEEAYAYELNFADPIFDELRADYHPKFDEWCEKISREHRACWIIQREKQLAAIVIRKAETHAEAKTVNTGPKILKISTFKVAADFRGQKLGEQLLKQILWYAQLNGFNLVYLTAYPKQKTLQMLLEAYGFTVTQKQANGEMFLEKVMERGTVSPAKGETAFMATSRAYPNFVCGPSVRKYVVPIRPQYHAMLFPEFGQIGPGDAGAATGRPGNTIEKVYLCHSKTATMRAGDVLLFYMSKGGSLRGSQSLTSVGIVKSVRWSSDVDAVKLWTAKRSVYSDRDLDDMTAGHGGPLMIIDFLLIGHLSAAISLDALTNGGILTSWPQSIVQLAEFRFAKLRELMDLGFEF